MLAQTFSKVNSSSAAGTVPIIDSCSNYNNIPAVLERHRNSPNVPAKKKAKKKMRKSLYSLFAFCSLTENNN
jgi:hypothetical protein